MNKHRFEHLSADDEAAVQQVEKALDDTTKKRLLKGVQLGVFKDTQNLKGNLAKVKKTVVSLGPEKSKVMTHMLSTFKDESPKIAKAVRENYITQRGGVKKDLLASDIRCYRELGTIRRYKIEDKYKKGIQDIIKDYPQAIKAIRKQMNAYRSPEELKSDLASVVEAYKEHQKKVESAFPGSIEAKYGSPANIAGLPHMKAFYLIVGFLIGYNWANIATVVKAAFDVIAWIASFTHWTLFGYGIVGVAGIVSVIFLVKFVEYLLHNYKHIIEMLGRNIGFVVMSVIVVTILYLIGIMGLLFSGISWLFVTLVAPFIATVAVSSTVIFLLYLISKGLKKLFVDQSSTSLAVPDLIPASPKLTITI